MSCGVSRRRGSDPTLLWLWRRPAATALIRPLAWEPPCATGAAIEKAKRQKNLKKIKKKIKVKFPGRERQTFPQAKMSLNQMAKKTDKRL